MRKIFFLTFFLQLLCLDLQLISSYARCKHPATRGYEEFIKALEVIGKYGFHTQVVPFSVASGKTMSKEVSKVVMKSLPPKLQEAIRVAERNGYRVLIPIKAS